jgi:hypothetical protein
MFTILVEAGYRLGAFTSEPRAAQWANSHLRCACTIIRIL